MPTFTYDWDDPWTVRYYEAFNERHGRYRRANQALVEHARLAAGGAVLDFAAGTGRTADVILPRIGPTGRILCVEPAEAMRKAGRGRLADPRVRWSAHLPAGGHYQRVLCGAAIWQVRPLSETIIKLARYLPEGGALCFNLPAQFLGQGDEPGGGRDPLLLLLPAKVAELAPCEPMEWDENPQLLTVENVEGYLEDAGLRPERFSYRYRLTQAEYRDWYKIPVLTNFRLSGLDANSRATLIDQAYAVCDPASWRWERWIGWSAWKKE